MLYKGWYILPEDLIFPWGNENKLRANRGKLSPLEMTLILKYAFCPINVIGIRQPFLSYVSISHHSR